jgi:23S rRNA pseudouridine1911/1915/1917 synthase
LDRFLATLEFVSSRSRGVELIDRGLVTLNGKALKAAHRVHSGDRLRIELPPPPASGLEPLNAPLTVMFEDDDLIVVDKPSGLVVHPAAGHAQDTLVNILLHHTRHLSMGFAENRPGIVHRLDRDTSGILVVAKNDFSHHALAEQFRRKTAHRIYWAVVFGVPPVRERTIRSQLQRHPQDRKRFASGPQGKLAVTHYKVLQTVASGLSWMQCKLETGRTHQIRVHLSEAGFPIVGDPIYGGKSRARSAGQRVGALLQKYPRLALHACELGFIHPRTQEQMFFRLGWPADLKSLVHELGFSDV